MPDTKITALAAITTVAPANDLFAIVDVSDNSMAASGTTKNITTNQILGAGGTATLASATITGDLTVRTNKLAVTSTGVGAGTASPLSVFTVQSQASARLSVRTTDAVFGTVTGGTALDSLNGSDASLVPFGVRGSTVTLGSSAGIGFQIDASGNATWQNVGGVAGTAMTLNATGLGVGVASPATKLDVSGGVGGIGGQNHATFSGNAGRGLVIGTRSDNVSSDRTATLNAPFTGGGIVLQTQGTDRLTLDSSGNVGIGVTPSAGKGCLQLSSGINFPATQVASSDANTLDDYEEGTFTATLKGGTTDPTTPVTATARYTKIGRQVTVNIYMAGVTTTGASGRIQIDGLPFANSSAADSICAVGFNGMATFTGSPFGVVVPSGTTIYMQSSVSGGAYQAVTFNAGTSQSLWVSLTYNV